MNKTLTNIELTDNQKTVLAKAVQNGAIDNPVVVSLDGEKETNARDVLDELGIIEYSHVHNTISIEPEYIDILKQEGIIDDMNQLTPETQQMLQPIQEQVTFLQYLKMGHVR
jgi:hypothetical protein